MKYFFLFLILFYLTNCSKPKTVLICGDHVCVNKTEAQQYFEENLALEVKIINKKNQKNIDLVELNLREDENGNKEINVYSKDKTKQNLKALSNKQKKLIKKKIKDKKRKKKVAKKKIEQNEESKKTNKRKMRKVKESYQKDNIFLNNVNKNTKKVVDICTLLEKCNIKEISKFLLIQGKDKKFPDITSRE